ncbi:threonine-phosphate decarboxylase CobD [Polycladidibacter hongkongensis]|uniref:threonine-phosphate decarboxylase CobD n=1 Tax=Polycladidibacter hongkongensis TaxID=1647556 RepID=UPI000837595B|nr:threonine-phosphate decarboxylase CobD [Pseudovibrio hongkongensis]
MLHGGDISIAIKAFGGETTDWLDLSTGINPTPYPIPNITGAAWQHLPTKVAQQQLLHAARQAYAVPQTAGIAAASGTQALIQLLPQLLPFRRVEVVGPTYASHAESWRAAGRDVHLTAQLTTPQSPTLQITVNPNNPDGRIHQPEALAAHANTLSPSGSMLLVDEAYTDLAPELSLAPYVVDAPLLLLRSFGKFFGLAGLRLGFLIGSPAICKAAEAQLGSWAIAGPALEIGAKALSDTLWQHQMRHKLRQRTKELHLCLQQHQLRIIGSTNLFTLIEHQQAKQLHRHLAQQHIWTRHFDYDATWLRIGLPKDTAKIARLGEALAGFEKGC